MAAGIAASSDVAAGIAAPSVAAPSGVWCCSVTVPRMRVARASARQGSIRASWSPAATAAAPPRAVLRAAASASRVAAIAVIVAWSSTTPRNPIPSGNGLVHTRRPSLARRCRAAASGSRSATARATCPDSCLGVDRPAVGSTRRQTASSTPSSTTLRVPSTSTFTWAWDTSPTRSAAANRPNGPASSRAASIARPAA